METGSRGKPAPPLESFLTLFFRRRGAVAAILASLFPTARRSSTDKAHNVSEMFIANAEENCEGKYIEVTAEPNGTFTVLNFRNNFKKTYTKQRRPRPGRQLV